MNSRNMKWITAVVIFAISCTPFLAMAQTDPGCGADCPIDGGLSFLLAAGVGYGVKRYREGRKNKQENAMIQ